MVDEVRYPAEEAVAAEWGLHPEEAKPRDLTFLHERRNALEGQERLEAYANQLRDGCKKLLSAVQESVDGVGNPAPYNEASRHRCRCCGAMTLWHASMEKHADGCVVPEMRRLCYPQVTEL